MDRAGAHTLVPLNDMNDVPLNDMNDVPLNDHTSWSH